MDELDQLQEVITEFLVTHEVTDVLKVLNNTIVACGDPAGLRQGDVERYIDDY
jgi:hypothetical protein